MTTFSIFFSYSYWSFQVSCLLLSHCSHLYVPRKSFYFYFQIYFFNLLEFAYIFSNNFEMKSTSIVISSLLVLILFCLLFFFSPHSLVSLVGLYKHLLVLMMKLTCLFSVSSVSVFIFVDSLSSTLLSSF